MTKVVGKAYPWKKRKAPFVQHRCVRKSSYIGGQSVPNDANTQAQDTVRRHTRHEIILRDELGS